MSNETLFFICGIALAVSAVLFSFIGLKVKNFPGKAFPVIVLWFAVLVVGSTTFAVLHAKDEDKARAAENEKAGKEIEAEVNDQEANAAPAEGGAEAEKGGEEAAAGAEGNAEAGAQVFASAGCVSCHTFKAANATGTVGPDLDEVLKSGTTTAQIEEDIVDPNAKITPGYSANIMPPNFGETLDSEELQDVVAFLYENSPAGEGK